MQYALSLNFEGSAAVEDTADGCRLLRLEGSGGPPESTDPWQILLQCEQWPQTEGEIAADLEIAGPMGGVLRGSLQRNATNLLTDGSGMGGACTVDLAFIVTSGSGWFAGAEGNVRVHGTLLPPDFLATADLKLEAPADAWIPPNSGLLTALEDASGASHVGPQPLAQQEAEVEAEERIRHQAAINAAAPGSSRGAPHAPERRLSHQGDKRTMAERPQEQHNPPGVTTGSPERPAQTLARPELAFDLEAELAGIKRERSWIEGDRDAKTLLKEADFRVVLVALKSGARMAQHETDARLTLQTLHGQLRIHLPSHVVTLPAGHLLALDRDVPHEVEAVEDSAFLLTLALVLPAGTNT